MLLLTGATGLIGSALLGRLLAEGEQVRCLVRDPRRLGTQRVRVQIALGDLTDPPSFRNALRGVDTVVAPGRFDPRPAPRLDRGAERHRHLAHGRGGRAPGRRAVRVLLSALGASTHHRTRCLRAKALAEQAVREADLQSIVFAPSIVYAPGDPWLTLLERMALLPRHARLGPRAGRAFQPIWAEDVADCVIAGPALAGRRAHARARAGRPGDAEPHRDRADRPRQPGPQPPAGARAHARRLARAAAARARHGAAGLRDLGRGRADGGLDAQPPAARPTRLRASGSSRSAMSAGACRAA